MQRKLFKRSTLGGIFANKQTNTNPDDSYRSYNRVAGLELNLKSNDSRFESETFFHKSFSPDKLNDATSFGQYLGYNHLHLEVGLGAIRAGGNYEADMGFVPRNGIWNIYRPITAIFNPKSKKWSRYINAFGIGIDGEDALGLDGKALDRASDLFAFVNNAQGEDVYIFYGRTFTHLFDEFDPTNASDNPNPDSYINVVPLPTGDYRYAYYGLGYNSSLRNKIYGSIEFQLGNYFNGKGRFVETSLTYRLQPYGLITIDAEYSHIALPEPYNTVKYWLVGPRAEMAFSKRIFFSTFFQYNSQTNNSNINARFQWRFKPFSDVFLVYTENYFAEGIPKYAIGAWTPKDRALMLKVTYWLNL